MTYGAPSAVWKTRVELVEESRNFNDDGDGDDDDDDDDEDVMEAVDCAVLEKEVLPAFFMVLVKYSCEAVCVYIAHKIRCIGCVSS
jgi:hypothetical protein